MMYMCLRSLPDLISWLERFLLWADKLQPCCEYRQWSAVGYLPGVRFCSSGGEWCVFQLWSGAALHPDIQATDTLGLKPGASCSSDPGTCVSVYSGVIRMLLTPGNILGGQPVSQIYNLAFQNPSVWPERTQGEQNCGPGECTHRLHCTPTVYTLGAG